MASLCNPYKNKIYAYKHSIYPARVRQGCRVAISIALPLLRNIPGETLWSGVHSRRTVVLKVQLLNVTCVFQDVLKLKIKASLQ